MYHVQISQNNEIRADFPCPHYQAAKVEYRKQKRYFLNRDDIQVVLGYSEEIAPMVKRSS